jgi:D-alanyl-D-alanine carboxypeptidase (penicillin-binding protein 5/6)
MKTKPQKRTAKIKKDLKKFWSVIKHEKLLGVCFILIALIFLLPALPIYQEKGESPKVPKIEVPVFPYPTNLTGAKPPSLSAKSIVVMDVPSSVILTAKNENLKLLPASTTKIMTALIALENYSPEEILTVGKMPKNGQAIGLLPGEKITVRNLLYGLLVSSGNDAARVLAENFPGGEPTFVSAMNQKAQELNLTNTHFENPTGVDNPNHYSTTLSLARLSLAALKNPFFAEIVATPKITVWDINHKIPHYLTNVNELVGKDNGVLGVKTGWTEEAGECLVVYVRRNNREIVSVILGSQDRFGETKSLIDWVFANFSWQEITPCNLNLRRKHRRKNSYRPQKQKSAAETFGSFPFVQNKPGKSV